MIEAGSRRERPLAILGATASGKSLLANAVAAVVDQVELVSIDSMQVYIGMDVGTATPSAAEQSAVRHHLINLVSPDTDFAVGEFQRHALRAVTDITARGATPVLVGGTGLYLRAVIDELDFPGQFPQVRAELEADPDTEGHYARLHSLDPLAAGRMEPTNRRRILRALEVCVGSGRPFSSFGPGLEAYPPTRYVQVALRWPRAELDERIAQRYAQQIEHGFLDEVERLATLDLGRTAAQALGYRELLSHVRGEVSLDEALELAIVRTRQFARRQERWFRRDPRIRWLDAPADAAAAIELWDQVRQSPAG